MHVNNKPSVDTEDVYAIIYGGHNKWQAYTKIRPSVKMRYRVNSFDTTLYVVKSRCSSKEKMQSQHLKQVTLC